MRENFTRGQLVQGVAHQVISQGQGRLVVVQDCSSDKQLAYESGAAFAG